MKKNVSIVVFYDKDKILLQDRKGISKYGEEFGFFGGHIEEGETPEQALKREIEEELTFQLDNFKFFKKYGPKIYSDSPHEVTHFVFLAKIPRLSLFNQKEGDDMGLFTLDEAKKLRLVKADYFIIDDLMKILKSKSP